MKTLKSELDELDASMRNDAPAAILGSLDAFRERLVQGGAAARWLQAGQRAPDFALPDATGTIVDSSRLRSHGPLILSFYRGAWCPYCNLALRSWQRHLPGLRALDATFVAISPQTPDASLTLVEKHALAYPVLSDLGHRVARQFGLVYRLDEAVRSTYEMLGVDLPAHNGDSSFELPVPATYLVDRDGTIAGAWVDEDHRVRAEPSEVLARLSRLTARSR